MSTTPESDPPLRDLLDAVSLGEVGVARVRPRLEAEVRAFVARALGPLAVPSEAPCTAAQIAQASAAITGAPFSLLPERAWKEEEDRGTRRPGDKETRRQRKPLPSPGPLVPLSPCPPVPLVPCPLPHGKRF